MKLKNNKWSLEPIKKKTASNLKIDKSRKKFKLKKMKKSILTFSILLLLVFSSFGQTSKFAGVYRCSNEDIVRLNSDGTGKFLISYVSDEVVSIKWSEYDNSISMSPTDEEQKYMIMPQNMTFSISNGKSILSHRTMGPTFVYIKD